MVPLWFSVSMMMIIMNKFEAIVAVEDGNLPLYWGWFIQEADSSEFLRISRQMLNDSLLAVPEFFSNVKEFTNQTSTEDIISYYSRTEPDSVLHCTAMYNGIYPDYKDGAEDYAVRSEVQESIDQAFTVHSIGWVLTPRTFGARLQLNDEQLILWNSNDTEVTNQQVVGTENHQTGENRRKQIIHREHNQSHINIIPQDDDILGNFQPTSGRGSRAHLTLGCAPGVGAVTTGLDLVDVIYQEGISHIPSIQTYDVTNGWLRFYGLGRWVFYPKTQVSLNSQFHGGALNAGTALKNSGFLVHLFVSCAVTLLGDVIFRFNLIS